jgi:PAS domain S-box-containing protein
MTTQRKRANESPRPPGRSDDGAPGGLTNGPRRRRTLRAALAVLLLSVWLPLVAVGAAFVRQQWMHRRSAGVERVQEHARTLRRAIDRELTLDLGVLRALAASTEIDRQDWRTFHAVAAEVAKARQESWVVLYDGTGQMIVNTRVPFGTPLPNLARLHEQRPEAEWEGRRLPTAGGMIRVPFDTGGPSFTGLVFVPVSKRPAVGSFVPVVRNGKAVYALGLLYGPDFFAHVLRSEVAPGERASLYDQRGRYIARSSDSAVYVGREGLAPFRSPSGRESGGEAINIEGTAVVYATTRSEVSEYVVASSMPRAAMLAPAWQALWIWVSVIACAVAVGSLLAFKLWRDIGTPLAALARIARSRELPSPIPVSSIEEVEALQGALAEAARSEDARRESEERFRRELTVASNRLRRILEANPIGVVLGDEAGHITEANDAYLRMIGRTREDLEHGAIQWDAITPQEHSARDEGAIAQARERGVSDVYEKEYVRSSGERVPVLVACASLGDSRELAAFVVDISDRKRAEEALRDAHAKLVEADRRKDDWLGMLSHELRNPLAPIRTSVRLLEHAGASEEQAKRARAVIARQTEHLARLVDDLLDVTRIVHGKVVLQRERLDLRDVVARAVEDAEASLQQRGVRLTLELPDHSVWVDADATRITQVIGNLLANARKFTQPADEVLVSLRQAGTAAELTVRDTGAGIDPELMPSLFDAFVQGKRTLARSEGGLGLGLATVRGLVQLHGGSVRASSEGQGLGAEFVVTLPTVEPLVAANRPHAEPRRAAGRRYVLVVDDNHDAAQSLADLVGLLGHDVAVAYDGPSAIKAAQARRPDVVLCDIGLPGKSGYEVAKVLRSVNGGPLRLVAVSGYAQAEDYERSKAAGFDAHVAKPPDLDQIESLLG